MCEFVLRSTTIAYDGSNSSEVLAFLNAIQMEAGLSEEWEIDSESGGVLILRLPTPGVPSFIEMTLNVDDRVTRQRTLNGGVTRGGPFTPSVFEDTFARVPSCDC